MFNPILLTSIGLGLVVLVIVLLMSNNKNDKEDKEDKEDKGKEDKGKEDKEDKDKEDKGKEDKEDEDEDYKYQKDVYIAYNENETDKKLIKYKREKNESTNFFKAECKKECDKSTECDAFQVVDNSNNKLNAYCTLYKIQDRARVINVPDNLKNIYTIGVKNGINIPNYK